MRRLTLPLLCCSLLLLPQLAPAAQAGESLWELEDDAKDEYAQLLREGDAFAEAAAEALSKANQWRELQGTSPTRREEERLRAAYQRVHALARRALEAYERAVKAAPTSAEPHYRAGEVLQAFMIHKNVSPPRPLDRAIEHWRQFERKAALDPRLPSMLNDRALALTKRGGRKNLRAAVSDWDHSLELIDQSSEFKRDEIGRLVSNRAELYMMLGELKKAITGYEQALAVNADTVYGYGLAVALDRDQQGARARDVARFYSKADSRNTALNKSSTFFVPVGEKSYYVAMRHEGRAEYREAIAAYEEFLRLWPTSPWAKRARENLKALAPKAAKQARKKARGRKGRSRVPWQLRPR